MRYRFLMRALDASRKRNPGDGFIPHGVTGNCLILGNVARRHAMDRARFEHRLGTEIETTITGCNTDGKESRVELPTRCRGRAEGALATMRA
jgi:hypothetical protein